MSDDRFGVLLGWRHTTPASRLPQRSSTVDSVWHNGEGHLLTVAPTGAGKGVSCIIPALLTWDGPAVVIDPKGENYAVTADYRRSLGQDIAVLDPFGITAAAERARLNPLDLVDIASPHAADDAAVITGLLMQEPTSRQDSFWDERGQVLVTGLILDLLYSDPAREDKSLALIRRSVDAAVAANPSWARHGGDLGFRCDWEANEPSVDIAAAKGILSMAADKTRSSILATASSHLSFLKGGPVLESLLDSTIRLDDVISGAPLTIYMVLPPDKLVTHAKLLRLWLGVILTTLTRRRRIPEKPTLLLIDEAAQLGRLNELRTALTLMRAYGVKVWTFWQDFAQLQALYPDWLSLLNNCAVQQFFGPATPLAAQGLALYLVQHGHLAHVLKTDELILLRPGRAPERLVRPNYLADRLFAHRAAPNPFHARGAGRACPYDNENVIDLFGGPPGTRANRPTSADASATPERQEGGE